MTLILKVDLDMVQMYLHAKNKVSNSRHSKVIAWTDRHTDTQTQRQGDTQTDRHDWRHYLPAYAGGNDCYLCRIANNSIPREGSRQEKLIVWYRSLNYLSNYVPHLAQSIKFSPVSITGNAFPFRVMSVQFDNKITALSWFIFVR